jgi:hypothetical protein
MLLGRCANKMKKRIILTSSVLLGAIVLCIVLFGMKKYHYYCGGGNGVVITATPIIGKATMHYIDKFGKHCSKERLIGNGLMYRPTVQSDIPLFENPFDWNPSSDLVEESFLETYRAQGHLGVAILQKYGKIETEKEVKDIVKQEASYYCTFNNWKNTKQAQPEDSANSATASSADL